MKYVKQDDWLEIRLGSIISDYDRRLLTILYQPLIMAEPFIKPLAFARGQYYLLFPHLLQNKSLSPNLFPQLPQKATFKGIVVLSCVISFLSIA